MTWERIPVESWQAQRGHVERYEWAGMLLHPGDVVMDVACGIGYGAQVLHSWGLEVDYHGFDRPGVPDPSFRPYGTFHGADLDAWAPPFSCDVSLCFETLEHIPDPARLARQLLQTSRRLVIASVPTVPTKHANPWHLHDFTVDTARDLFAGASHVHIEPQPRELAHLFYVTP